MKVSLNSYREHRKAAYPAIEEQLDMLWHAMDQGNTPKIEPWYSVIKGVKEQYRKDNK